MAPSKGLKKQDPTKHPMPSETVFEGEDQIKTFPNKCKSAKVSTGRSKWSHTEVQIQEEVRTKINVWLHVSISRVI